MAEILEWIADYMDSNSIDYAIFRDEGDWCLQLRFSDASGPYSRFIDLEAVFKLRKQLHGKLAFLEKQIKAECVAARAERMVKLTKRPMAAAHV